MCLCKDEDIISQQNRCVPKKDHTLGYSCIQRQTGHVSQHQKKRSAHLTKLQARFDNYFPEKYSDNDWVRDPFCVDMESVTLASNKEHQLVELSCDQTMKKRFGEVTLSHFWCSDVMAEYSSFATLAEKARRNRLDTEHDLRVALSTVIPDFETLIKKKTHAQLSH